MTNGDKMFLYKQSDLGLHSSRNKTVDWSPFVNVSAKWLH